MYCSVEIQQSTLTRCCQYPSKSSEVLLCHDKTVLLSTESNLSRDRRIKIKKLGTVSNIGWSTKCWQNTFHSVTLDVSNTFTENRNKVINVECDADGTKKTHTHI